MERNVARLFQERGPIFGEVELTQASVLAGTHAVSLVLQQNTHRKRTSDSHVVEVPVHDISYLYS